MMSALPLPALLAAGAGGFTLRRARGEDLAALVGLLSDDQVSAARGDTSDAVATETYRSALTELIGDVANEVIVVVDDPGDVVGTMQLTRIPGVARRGATRLQVEAVRVRADRRSSGLGSAMMRWVTEAAAPATGASLVQLTSDDGRPDAHRFYERLGFVGSHRGFKFSVG